MKKIYLSSLFPTSAKHIHRRVILILPVIVGVTVLAIKVPGVPEPVIAILGVLCVASIYSTPVLFYKSIRLMLREGFGIASVAYTVVSGLMLLLCVVLVIALWPALMGI